MSTNTNNKNRKEAYIAIHKSDIFCQKEVIQKDQVSI